MSSDFQLAEVERKSLTERIPKLPVSNSEAGYKIKLHEFYNLPDCGIKPIIAERNTTLGKIQSPSQRYLYEVRLISALISCLKDASPSEVDKINDIINRKQSQLAQSWQDLLLRSEEIQFALYNPAVNTNSEQKQDFAITRWHQLKEFSPDKILHSEQKTPDDLELILGEIYKDQTPARIWNDIELIARQLPQITAWLVTETEPLDCNLAKHKTKVEYMRNVFNLFFIQKVQPQSANLNGWLYELSPALEALYLTSEIPQSVKDYIRVNTRQNFQQYKATIKDHVLFWQKLFKRCNVSPVAPVQR